MKTLDYSDFRAEIHIRKFAPIFARLLPWCFRGNSSSITGGSP